MSHARYATQSATHKNSIYLFFCNVDCHNCDQMLIRLTSKFAIYRLWGDHFILALMHELQSSLKIFTVTVRWRRTINHIFLSWFSCGFSYIFIYTKNLIQIHQNFCLSVIHHKSLYVDFLLHLEEYSLKLCILTYCFMEKCMSLHHFLWQFIFLFWLRILYKKCVGGRHTFSVKNRL